MGIKLDPYTTNEYLYTNPHNGEVIQVSIHCILGDEDCPLEDFVTNEFFGLPPVLIDNDQRQAQEGDALVTTGIGPDFAVPQNTLTSIPQDGGKRYRHTRKKRGGDHETYNSIPDLKQKLNNIVGRLKIVILYLEKEKGNNNPPEESSGVYIYSRVPARRHGVVQGRGSGDSENQPYIVFGRLTGPGRPHEFVEFKLYENEGLKDENNQKIVKLIPYSGRNIREAVKFARDNKKTQGWVFVKNEPFQLTSGGSRHKKRVRKTKKWKLRI